MCPFEFTATPETSPKYKSGGSCKKSGTERNGISGTGGCCAQREQGVRSNTRSQNLMGDLRWIVWHHDTDCISALSSNVARFGVTVSHAVPTLNTVWCHR